MNLTTDAAEWAALAKATPARPPASAHDRAAFQPGTDVQSATLCGVVHQHDDAGAVVIGHGWTNSSAERFVWRGTPAEFAAEWRLD